MNWLASGIDSWVTSCDEDSTGTNVPDDDIDGLDNQL